MCKVDFHFCLFIFHLTRYCGIVIDADFADVSVLRRGIRLLRHCSSKSLKNFISLPNDNNIAPITKLMWKLICFFFHVWFDVKIEKLSLLYSQPNDSDEDDFRNVLFMIKISFRLLCTWSLTTHNKSLQFVECVNKVICTVNLNAPNQIDFFFFSFLRWLF